MYVYTDLILVMIKPQIIIFPTTRYDSIIYDFIIIKRNYLTRNKKSIVQLRRDKEHALHGIITCRPVLLRTLHVLLNYTSCVTVVYFLINLDYFFSTTRWRSKATRKLPILLSEFEGSRYCDKFNGIVSCLSYHWGVLCPHI